MPMYTLRNTETDEVVEELLRISEMEEMIENGEWVVVPSAPILMDHMGSQIKGMDDDSRSILKALDKKAGRHSKIKDILP